MSIPNLTLVESGDKPEFKFKAFNERWYEALDMRPILHDVCQRVGQAYYHAGPTAAFAAIAGEAVRLQYHVESGALVGHTAESCLRDIAGSLNLANELSEDLLEFAIHAGAEFYQSIADYEAKSRNAA